MTVRVQSEVFDAGAELNAFAIGHSDVGAVVSFTGVVRDLMAPCTRWKSNITPL